jgi:hypothetical protein
MCDEERKGDREGGKNMVHKNIRMVFFSAFWQRSSEEWICKWMDGWMDG